MTHDPENSFSDLDDWKNQLSRIQPAPTSASLARVFERIESPSICTPVSSPSNAIVHYPMWAAFGSGAGFGAIAATIAWIAISSWIATGSLESKHSTEPSVLLAPSTSLGKSGLDSTMEIKSSISTSKSTSPSPLYSLENEEFGIDMIRNTLSVVSKKQWDRRRLEERGYSISAQPNRFEEPNASPSTRSTMRPYNSVWEIGRGNLDSLEL